MVCELILNQRHKIGLFLTVILAGGCLLVGLSLKETCGAVMLGLAFSWAFGANSRPLHLGLASIGLLILATPFISALVDYSKQVLDHRRQLQNFDQGLAQLAREHPDLSGSEMIPMFDPGDPSGSQPRMVPAPYAEAEAQSGSTYAFALIDPRDKVAKWVPENDLQRAFAVGGVPANMREGERVRTIERSQPVPHLPDGATLLSDPNADPHHEYKTDRRVVTVPSVGEVDLKPITTSSREFALMLQKQHPQVPRWYLDALRAGVDPGTWDHKDPPLIEPTPIDPLAIATEGYPLEIPGILMVACFGGTFWVVLGKPTVAFKENPAGGN